MELDDELVVPLAASRPAWKPWARRARLSRAEVSYAGTLDSSEAARGAER